MKTAFYSLLILCSLFFWGSCVDKQASPGIVTVDGGQIIGTSTNTPDVMLYAGIPYAAPPVGELRWKEPQAVIPWEGVRNMDKFPKVCYQDPMPVGSFYEKEFYQDGLPELSEDCLYLNVWAPLEKEGKKLPVVMWIHGGAFDHGWGHEMEFDGDAYVKNNVILVTINYRVGIFGFMAHPLLTAESPDNSSGNYGILDQIAALKWIRNNISAFGGDPNQITIMGQSAGASSVMALLSSPLTKGLISKAIIQSGGGYGRGAGMAQLIDREVDCKDYADFMQADDLSKLRAISPTTLMEQHKAYNAARQEKGERGIRFSPNVDGYVFTDNYDVTLDKGNQHLVPSMIGYNAQDGSPSGLERAATQWSLKRNEQGQPQTYIYFFERQLPGDDSGAFHSAELWYTFGTLERSWRPFTEADDKLSDKMITYWTNFIKTGNPNSSHLPVWEAYNESNSFIQSFDIEK